MTSANRRTENHPFKFSPVGRISLTLLICVLLGSSWTACSSKVDPPANESNETTASPPPESLPANLDEALEKKSEEPDGGEYSKFTHSTEYHSRLPCLVCHQRENNSPRISLPGKIGHSPCAGCHTLQFADENSSICTVCHTDAKEGKIKSFPRLKNFGSRFNHAKHLRTNCATCHKPSRGGVALSIPAGSRAHSTCFQCHSSKASNNMASCGLCHQQGGGRIRRSESAKAFAVNFSHAKHRRTNCSACHTVMARSRSGRQVTAPVAAMHFARKGVKSCATCHNNKNAFGGDDFADCRRCHTGGSFKF